MTVNSNMKVKASETTYPSRPGRPRVYVTATYDDGHTIEYWVDQPAWDGKGGYHDKMLNDSFVHTDAEPINPTNYVVADGNVLWLEDSTGDIWHAPMALNGVILWDDAGPVEDWSGWADDVADRIRDAVFALPSLGRYSRH